ncbi:hypothetical protein [Peribacillus simplex]|uniref:hypothetical protein n=1 Tax=Peribacillus simplex TaxID=1478 RepID=UPI003D265DEC
MKLKIRELLIFILIGSISVIIWGVINPSNHIVQFLVIFLLSAFGGLAAEKLRKRKR